MNEMVQQFKENLFGLGGNPFDEIVAFMTEMREARHSGFYTDERYRQYHALNIDNYISIARNLSDNNSGTRVGVVLSMIAKIPAMRLIENVDYY